MKLEKLQSLYEKKKDSFYFKKTLSAISKDALESMYKDNSRDAVLKYFHLTVETFECLMYHYQIPFRTKEEENELRVKHNKESRIKNSGSLEESYKQSITKQKQTLIDRYGSLEDAYLSQKTTRDNTIRNIYNVDNVFQSKEIKDKIKQTNLSRYGVEYAGQIESFKDKMNETKLNNWGLDNYGNWQKGHETRIKNSGSLEQSYQNGVQTFKQTMLERYGVESVFQLDSVNRNKKHSKPNEQFARILDMNFIQYEREFALGTKSYDFKVGNKLIEINPTVTHNSTYSIFKDSLPLESNYHQDKSKLARDNNYQCIHVWDWDDVEKVIALLQPRKKLYARNCVVKEVSKDAAKEFISKYHLQGYSKDDIRIGLYYNDELVSIMTFGKPRYNKNYEYELIRYCSSYSVTGGSEKLFKHFIKTYNPKNIISYCDYSKFSGQTYTRLGFKLKSISVGRHWFDGKTHITDNLLRQRGFDQLFNTNYGKGTSNDQLMKEAGFAEIYDAGQATYIFDN